MQFELSICIPTYNRSVFLKSALDSIISQLDDTQKSIVEICISDNASDDDTPELIEQYKRIYPHITYLKRDKNYGPDDNFLKVIEIASGKYCWFLGSDDTIYKGSIKKVLGALKNRHNIYIFDRYDCDIHMNIIKKHNFFKKHINSKTFYFGEPQQLEQYLLSIKTIGALFGYLSSIVFEKKSWDSITFDKSFIGSAYSYTYILLSLLKSNISLGYIKDYLVCCRAGNDCFSIEGIEKRLMIDINGYLRLFNVIFSEYIDAKYYIDLVFAETFKFPTVLYFMSVAKHPAIIEEGFARVGYGKMFFFFIKILKRPYILIRRVKNFFKRKLKTF